MSSHTRSIEVTTVVILVLHHMTERPASSTSCLPSELPPIGLSLSYTTRANNTSYDPLPHRPPRSRQERLSVSSLLHPRDHPSFFGAAGGRLARSPTRFPPRRFGLLFPPSVTALNDIVPKWIPRPHFHIYYSSVVSLTSSWSAQHTVPILAREIEHSRIRVAASICT